MSFIAYIQSFEELLTYLSNIFFSSSEDVRCFGIGKVLEPKECIIIIIIYVSFTFWAMSHALYYLRLKNDPLR